MPGLLASCGDKAIPLTTWLTGPLLFILLCISSGVKNWSSSEVSLLAYAHEISALTNSSSHYFANVLHFATSAHTLRTVQYPRLKIYALLGYVAPVCYVLRIVQWQTVHGRLDMVFLKFEFFFLVDLFQEP